MHKLAKKNCSCVLIMYVLWFAQFVVDFYGTVCPPCKAFAPVYDELAKKYPECVFVKVNIDELWEIEDAEDVTGVPYLKVFRAGKEVGSIAGPNADELEKTIKENM
eukprot:TRINITY_DN615_c0_g1_i10.p3 TRINITY_DN615_c0_g1~~TRINITY_DN615_c0_g1_i10.p3  ORF type:complete len:106 (-),score=30.73 TRINITY_DN615_c0_g1_i10:101-418(-)